MISWEGMLVSLVAALLSCGPGPARDGGPASSAPPASTRDEAPEISHLAVGQDVDLTIALSGVDQEHDGQKPHLEISSRRAGRTAGAVVLDFTTSKYPELADVIGPSVFWSIESSVAELGPKRVGRVGLVGRAGDDLAVMQEIAILLDVESEPRVLWIGRGDREVNQFDVCVIETHTDFRMPRPSTLERTERSTRVVSRSEDGDPHAGYRKRCKAPPPRRDRYPLPAP